MRYETSRDGNQIEEEREFYLNWRVTDTETDKPAWHFYNKEMADNFCKFMNGME